MTLRMGFALRRAVAAAVVGIAASAVWLGGDDARANLFGPAIEAPTDADFRGADPAMVELGRLLFYDKVLSGNRNISCGECHNHDLASGDAVSLGVGEGGAGLGVERATRSKSGRVKRRVPRNAPALFNLGAFEFTTLFHDGRVETDIGRRYKFVTPAGEYLPMGLDSPLAAQALFPLVSQVEMAGEPQENALAEAASHHPTLGWEIVEQRIRETPGYLPLFQAAFPRVESADDITIVDYANAVGAFVGTEWRADNSPYDRYLRGDGAALSAEAQRGLDLFYGGGGCGECHAGKFQTDHLFHAIAMPQIGPGKTLYFDHLASDFGRMGVSHERDDAYRFRTPSLRNVTETAPYGHSGAYATLEQVVRHHLDPEAAFRAYDPSQALLPKDAFLARKDRMALADETDAAAILEANELAPVSLTEAEIGDLLAFLAALTDETGLKGRLGKPTSVPSGLPVD